MNAELLKVSLRKNAIHLSQPAPALGQSYELTETTGVLLTNCKRLGFTFSEALLHAVNQLTPRAKLAILNHLKTVTGVKKNWTPLVKQWDISTGESRTDHIMTWIANVMRSPKGTRLACGHMIPEGTFPLERYNGCPFCGTPFVFDELDYEADKNKLKTLQLWTDEDLNKELVTLMESPVASDATQIDSLTILLEHLGLPAQVDVKMKETMMVVLDALISADKADDAAQLIKGPTDLLRYLWFKHTGFLQIVEPKTIANRMAKNHQNHHRVADESIAAKIQSLMNLKLKYSRKECYRYASWLNGIQMDIATQCEQMHPKRGMWVRMIRALRLAEYSKKPGFERLEELLDNFYNQKYEVWQGKVNHYKLKADAENTFALLKQRPGLFARSLFSTMLWFGPVETIQYFRSVLDKVPARLIFTLNMYAESYFVKGQSRAVKPLGGLNKKIPVNQWLELYSDESLKEIQKMVQGLSLEVIKKKLGSIPNDNETIYIAKGLENIPIAIGDRSEQLQDLPGAQMGTRFPVEGSKVRLFLQWGEGLKAQHLDMDLSCNVIYENRNEFCSYSQLVIPGCKHSGDIQRIPHLTGTAEYIEIDLKVLQKNKAKYVCFTCNAYTNGSLEPNLVVGWMNSAHRMKISKSGVAYDPTTVQHQVRVKRSLSKGMVFGVLDVAKAEIIWLEMGFGGQIVQNMSSSTVEALMIKLDAKLKLAELLELKAEIQSLTKVEDPELADEVYDLNWAMDTAAVSALFLD